MLNREQKLSIDLSIVIATFNRINQLKSALKSLESIKNYTFEIVIADGGSTDGTLEFLKSSKIENLKILEQGKLIGSARAYNEAFKHCTGNYVLWFSDDTRLVGGSVEKAIAVLEQVETIGMVGLKMKDTIGRFRHQAYLGGVCRFGILNCNHGILRNHILKSIGGFNEDYKSYMIDPDLTASVLCSGADICLSREISVLHDRDWSLGDPNHSRMKAPGGIDNNQIYFEKFCFLDKYRDNNKAVTLAKQITAKILKEVAFLFPNTSALRDLRNSLLMKFREDHKYQQLSKDFHMFQSVPREATLEFKKNFIK